ncbi:MAG: sigma-70 family RNA polymerase sigma factor [Fuerstiella sp.]
MTKPPANPEESKAELSHEGASEEFIRSFTAAQRPLFLYLLPMLGNPVDAEEVLQETNVVIWRKWHQFELGTNFIAWGRTIARLEVFRYRRNKGNKIALLDDGILELVSTRLESQPSTLDGRRREALSTCIQRLKPKDREIIRLRYEANSNGDQVAKQLGRPPNSVYQSLGRIRRTLMKCIEQQVETIRLAEEGGLS